MSQIMNENYGMALVFGCFTSFDLLPPQSLLLKNYRFGALFEGI